MRHHVFLLVCLCVCYSAAGGARVRRSLVQFADMIQRVTGRKALDFNGYGNWCGFGGSGEPVDPIDRCCKEHDHCYDRIYEHECNNSKQPEIVETYATKYNWTLSDGHLLCESPDICRRTLCGCDTEASRCFAENLEWYNNSRRSMMGKIVSSITDFVG